MHGTPPREDQDPLRRGGVLCQQPRRRIAVHGPQDQNFADEIVCFDIETTGLKVEREAITEIAPWCCATVRWRSGSRPSSTPTPPDAGDRGPDGHHGCHAGRRSPAEGGLTSFLEFVGIARLAAHNAEFDISFIRAGCRKVGLPFDPTYCGLPDFGPEPVAGAAQV